MDNSFRQKSDLKLALFLINLAIKERDIDILDIHKYANSFCKFMRMDIIALNMCVVSIKVMIKSLTGGRFTIKVHQSTQMYLLDYIANSFFKFTSPKYLN